MSFYSDEQWMSWMDELADNDYVIVDDFIDEEHFNAIRDFFSQKEETEQLKKAGIGNFNEVQIQSEIRGDFIYWLDRERDDALEVSFKLLDECMSMLKRYCFISLSSGEFHLAKYPPGSFYAKHLDQFQERNNRQITVLLYLNEDWKKGNGGELKIYKNEDTILVEPIARRLLLFKSDTIEHEVLKTAVDRYSLTGWYLYKPTTLSYIFN